MRLSPEQYMALRFLQAYTFEHGEAPTYKEIAEHCGIHLQTIVQKFRRLRARGLIEQHADRSLRPWKLTPDGHRALALYDIAAVSALNSVQEAIRWTRKPWK